MLSAPRPALRYLVFALLLLPPLDLILLLEIRRLLPPALTIFWMVTDVVTGASLVYFALGRRPSRRLKLFYYKGLEEMSFPRRMVTLAAGLLLLLPGPLTDLLAILLLVPVLRRRLLEGSFSRFLEGSAFGPLFHNWAETYDDASGEGPTSVADPNRPRSGLRKPAVRDAEFEILQEDEKH